MASGSMIRATHGEREGTVEVVRAAYAGGCLDDGELEERTSLAYAAKTRGERRPPWPPQPPPLTR